MICVRTILQGFFHNIASETGINKLLIDFLPRLLFRQHMTNPPLQERIDGVIISWIRRSKLMSKMFYNPAYITVMYQCSQICDLYLLTSRGWSTKNTSEEVSFNLILFLWSLINGEGDRNRSRVMNSFVLPLSDYASSVTPVSRLHRLFQSAIISALLDLRSM